MNGLGGLGEDKQDAGACRQQSKGTLIITVPVHVVDLLLVEF